VYIPVVVVYSTSGKAVVLKFRSEILKKVKQHVFSYT